MNLKEEKVPPNELPANTDLSEQTLIGLLRAVRRTSEHKK